MVLVESRKHSAWLYFLVEHALVDGPFESAVISEALQRMIDDAGLQWSYR